MDSLSEKAKEVAAKRRRPNPQLANLADVMKVLLEIRTAQYSMNVRLAKIESRILPPTNWADVLAPGSASASDNVAGAGSSSSGGGGSSSSSGGGGSGLSPRVDAASSIAAAVAAKRFGKRWAQRSRDNIAVKGWVVEALSQPGVDELDCQELLSLVQSIPADADDGGNEAEEEEHSV